MYRDWILFGGFKIDIFKIVIVLIIHIFQDLNCLVTFKVMMFDVAIEGTRI